MLVHPHASGDAVHDDSESLGGHGLPEIWSGQRGDGFVRAYE
jgi:hypothetical protein